MADGTRLHYLDSDPDGTHPGPPLLYVHGAIGTAEDFAAHLVRHGQRRCLALSMRGMGRSDTPPSGYGFEDKVADIEAVVASAGPEAVCLFGFSLGVPCVLGYALAHPERVRALVLADYGAQYPALDESWVRATDGVPIERVRPEARRAMARESRLTDLWPRLPDIRCPVLVIRGGAGGLLSAEGAAGYGHLLRRCTVAVMPTAGHVLWPAEPDTFCRKIEHFLSGLS